MNTRNSYNSHMIAVHQYPGPTKSNLRLAFLPLPMNSFSSPSSFSYFFHSFYLRYNGPFHHAQSQIYSAQSLLCFASHCQKQRKKFLQHVFRFRWQKIFKLIV